MLKQEAEWLYDDVDGEIYVTYNLELIVKDWPARAFPSEMLYELEWMHEKTNHCPLSLVYFFNDKKCFYLFSGSHGVVSGSALDGSGWSNTYELKMKDDAWKYINVLKHVHSREWEYEQLRKQREEEK